MSRRLSKRMALADLKVMDAARKIIGMTGEGPPDSPLREGLFDTPARFLNAWRFYLRGYFQDDNMTTFVDGSENYDEMVFEGNIRFYSHCEHHLAPFFGVAHIAYIPKGKIIGLSKIVRIVEMFAARLQVQERLTTNISDFLWRTLEPQGVAVMISARHMCMESRGVRAPGTVTITNSLIGDFRSEDSARAEYMSLCAPLNARVQL